MGTNQIFTDLLSTNLPFLFIQSLNVNTKENKQLVRYRRKAEEVRRKRHMVKKQDIKDSLKNTLELKCQNSP